MRLNSPVSLNIGLNYELGGEEVNYEPPTEFVAISKTFKYNFVLRSGISQTDVVGSKQFPFCTLSAYADKRINFFSAFQLGVEAFFSKALEEEIHYRSVAFPEMPSDPYADYKRV